MDIRGITQAHTIMRIFHAAAMRAVTKLWSSDVESGFEEKVIESLSEQILCNPVLLAKAIGAVVNENDYTEESLANEIAACMPESTFKSY